MAREDDKGLSGDKRHAGKLDAKARERVEAVLRERLGKESDTLQDLKSTVQDVLQGEDVSARLTNQRIFIGIWIDEQPVGVWF